MPYYIQQNSLHTSLSSDDAMFKAIFLSIFFLRHVRRPACKITFCVLIHIVSSLKKRKKLRQTCLWSQFNWIILNGWIGPPSWLKRNRKAAPTPEKDTITSFARERKWKYLSQQKVLFIQHNEIQLRIWCNEKGARLRWRFCQKHGTLKKKKNQTK